jgi:hypothetical protein
MIFVSRAVTPADPTYEGACVIAVTGTAEPVETILVSDVHTSCEEVLVSELSGKRPVQPAVATIMPMHRIIIAKCLLFMKKHLH